MENGKLMKIVQAVNDSKGKPVGLGSYAEYKYIARGFNAKLVAAGDVHAVNGSATFKSWQYICTVEEFNQCVKEMSAGYGKEKSKSSHKHVDTSSHIHIGGVTEEVTRQNSNKIKFKDKAVKNNKHPHHDLIVEWAKDTSKPLQEKYMREEKWINIEINTVVEDVTGEDVFRFKPREFVKGHWYPCSCSFHDKGTGYPIMFDGKGFVNHKEDGFHRYEADFRFIGESLGEINFGGGE